MLLALLAGCGQDAPEAAAPAPAASQAAAPAPAAPAVAPRLPDVTAAAGIDFTHVRGEYGKKFLFETMGTGAAADDFDGDGLPDLILLQSGTLPPEEFSADERQRATYTAGETARLYLNEGGWRFRDATAGSGLDVALYAMGCTAGDVDADGDRDLYVGAYGRSRLFLNDGHARFRDASAESGLNDPLWTINGAFLDAELDGDLDLYAVAYLDMPIGSNRFCGPSKDLRTYCHVDAWPGLQHRLWINDGSGHFTDGTEAAGMLGVTGKGLAAVASDLDDDGDQDVFVADDSTPHLLWRNDGGGRFTNAARRAGVDFNGEGRTTAGMGIACADLDAMDADTQVNERAVGTALAVLRAGAVGGGCVFDYDGPTPLWGRIILFFAVLAARLIRWVGGCFVFCTREAYNAAGGFSESLYAGEDIAFVQALKKVGRFVVLKPKVVSSGRKLEVVGPWQVLGLMLIIAMRGARYESKWVLDILYGRRAQDCRRPVKAG